MCVDASLQDVDASEIKVQVCVYAFDLLYLNGEVRPGDDEENITPRSLSTLLSPFKNQLVCACLLFVSVLTCSSPHRDASNIPECQWWCYRRPLLDNDFNAHCNSSGVCLSVCVCLRLFLSLCVWEESVPFWDSVCVCVLWVVILTVCGIEWVHINPDNAIQIIFFKENFLKGIWRKCTWVNFSINWCFMSFPKWLETKLYN